MQEVVVSREKVEERLLAGLAIHRAGCDAHMRGWEPCSYSSEDSQCWILSRSSSMIGFHGSTFSGQEGILQACDSSWRLRACVQVQPQPHS